MTDDKEYPNTSHARKRVTELENLEKAASPGPWNVCGGGKCSCKMVWTKDNPITKVIHGKWGDDYPSIRLAGDSLDLKAEAYMEQITYGEIPEGIATADAIMIVEARNVLPALIACTKTLAEVQDVLVDMKIIGGYTSKDLSALVERVDKVLSNL